MGIDLIFHNTGVPLNSVEFLERILNDIGAEKRATDFAAGFSRISGQLLSVHPFERNLLNYLTNNRTIVRPDPNNCKVVMVATGNS